MRDGVGDPRWQVPFGNLEQSSGLVREPLCERNIGFALLRWLLHPLPSTTPLSVRDRGGNRRMSLVSPPSEPKLMTVPVPSASKSATSPNRRPPTLSIATWIVGALGGRPDAVLPAPNFRREKRETLAGPR